MARINPTRSELLKLKRRIKLAVRGHKLLKEKRDGLMVQFIRLIRDCRCHREDLDARLDRAFSSLAVSHSLMRTGDLESLFNVPFPPREVDVKTRYIMATRVPTFSLKEEQPRKHYGYYGVPAEVDVMSEEFNGIIQNLVKLAETEKAIKLLAQDVEKTRRRVNALEHIVIPNLKNTAKRIEMKLDEMERSSFTTLGIVKGMIEEKEERSRASEKSKKPEKKAGKKKR